MRTVTTASYDLRSYCVNLRPTLLETGEEMLVHASPELAERAFTRVLSWYESRSAEMTQRPAMQFEYTRTLSSLGRWNLALASARDLIEADPGNPEYIGLIGSIYARLGHRDTAEVFLNQLAGIKDRYLFGLPTLASARIATALGDVDAGRQLLREAFRRGRPYDVWLHRDIFLKPIVETGEFDGLTFDAPGSR